MRRRDFIKAIAGLAAFRPIAARGQQPSEHVRRIGMLMNYPDDAEGQTRISTFVQALEQLGWTEGRTYGSTFAGPLAISNLVIVMRLNWWRSHRT